VLFRSQVSIKSPTVLLIQWCESAGNGSPITEYRLEFSTKRNEAFTQIYCGPLLRYELKGVVQPATKYYFRLQAVNANGSSSFSQPVECTTLASVPGMVSGLKLDEAKSNSILVTWRQPASNGCPVVFYNLDISDATSNNNTTASYIVVHNKQPVCEYKIESLLPDTLYKLRVQAANSVGVGHFSNIIKVKTKALAPGPPNLDCVSASYNSIKLKWNAALFPAQFDTNTNTAAKSALNDSQLIYNLEMMKHADEFDSKMFNSVYKGTANYFKVNKLQESTNYLFRISCLNETGQGKWSDIYKFKTTKSPPVITKAPTVSDLNTHSCLVEWQPAKIEHDNSDDQSSPDQLDTLEYCLQMQTVKKDAEFRDVYKGDSCSHRLTDLEANTEYNIRLCAIRVSSSKRICSSFTSYLTFSTPKLLPKNKTPAAKPNELSAQTNSNQMSHSGFLSRFIWPSFYLNFNAETSGGGGQKMVAANSKKTAHAGKSTSRRLSTSTHSDNLFLNSTNLNNADSSQRHMSDQQWALIFILALVLFAFLIAFVANSMYTSYYDQLSSEL